jgi:carboxymethylenebutenolidase
MRIALALALLLAGCHHEHRSPPAMHPTGGMSEEEFKALHQLRGDHSPAPTGTMIDLGGARAYLSLPAGATGPVPGIVVVHEWWGLNEHIEHWADRLAGLGYAALAVDLYGGKTAETPDDAMALMNGVQEDAAKQVLADAVTFLETDARVKAPKVGVIGWCFGGGWSLETALEHPEIEATVMYYGMPETDVGRLKSVKHLLGFFANKDTFITPEIVDGFEQNLKDAGVDATILRYDADHAFANPSGPHYDEAAATDAWAHVVPFFAEHLGSGKAAMVTAPAAGGHAPSSCHATAPE